MVVIQPVRIGSMLFILLQHAAWLSAHQHGMLQPLASQACINKRKCVSNFASCAGLLTLSCLLFLQNTWRDATALANSKQDDVNHCAAMIKDFKASIRDVTEELEHVVRECAELDRSPGKAFL